MSYTPTYTRAELGKKNKNDLRAIAVSRGLVVQDESRFKKPFIDAIIGQQNAQANRGGNQRNQSQSNPPNINNVNNVNNVNNQGNNRVIPPRIDAQTDHDDSNMDVDSQLDNRLLLAQIQALRNQVNQMQQAQSQSNVSSNHSMQSQSPRNNQPPGLQPHAVAFSNPVATYANALLQPSQAQQQPQQQQQQQQQQQLQQPYLQQQQSQPAAQPQIPLMPLDPQSNEQAGVFSSEQIQDFFRSVNRTTDVKNTQQIAQELSAGL